MFSDVKKGQEARLADKAKAETHFYLEDGAMATVDHGVVPSDDGGLPDLLSLISAASSEQVSGLAFSFDAEDSDDERTFAKEETQNTLRKKLKTGAEPSLYSLEQMNLKSDSEDEFDSLSHSKEEGETSVLKKAAGPLVLPSVAEVLSHPFPSFNPSEHGASAGFAIPAVTPFFPEKAGFEPARSDSPHPPEVLPKLDLSFGAALQGKGLKTPERVLAEASTPERSSLPRAYFPTEENRRKQNSNKRYLQPISPDQEEPDSPRSIACQMFFERASRKKGSSSKRTLFPAKKIK